MGGRPDRHRQPDRRRRAAPGGPGALRGIAIIPIAGILTGGAMTATSLAGRRFNDDLRARRGEVEAALALGLPPRDAVLLVCRPAASQALIPALDQTRTVGLVTLPGAFVGVLLGGASCRSPRASPNCSSSSASSPSKPPPSSSPLR
ncbi:ABC transporter permease [Micromonospora sp. BRA006-A]|nr:ABC transporter permease [Micromonospora sp. BRA006-A]